MTEAVVMALGWRAASLLTTLERGDLIAATDELADAVKERLPVLIDEVIAPVMVEIGRRWQIGEWTVAQQHAASATVDAALAAIETRYLGAAVSGPAMIIACVEDEWHTLPARLAALRFRAEGCNVTFLGPSVPADHIAAHLHRAEAAVLGLSCTMPTGLGGARRAVEVAHLAGVPVVVGGAAFDPAGRRAAAIGADALGGRDDVATFLARPHRRPPGRQPTKVRGRSEAADLQTGLDALIDAAMGEMTLQDLSKGFDCNRYVQPRGELVSTILYAAAAIDVAEPELFHNFIGWARARQRALGRGDHVLVLSLDVLQHVLRPHFPVTTRLLGSARRRLASSSAAPPQGAVVAIHAPDRGTTTLSAERE